MKPNIDWSDLIAVENWIYNHDGHCKDCGSKYGKEHFDWCGVMHCPGCDELYKHCYCCCEEHE